MIQVERINLQSDIAEALKKLGDAVQLAHARAAEAAAQVIVDEANRLAPGPYIQMDRIRKTVKGIEVVKVGPDMPHWHYRFFETGVLPFEINLLTKRTKRGGGGGRPIRSDVEALRFGGPEGQQFASVVYRGGMAARPFLRPALDTKAEAMQQAFEAELLAAIKELER